MIDLFDARLSSSAPPAHVSLSAQRETQNLARRVVAKQRKRRNLITGITLAVVLSTGATAAVAAPSVEQWFATRDIAHITVQFGVGHTITQCHGTLEATLQDPSPRGVAMIQRLDEFAKHHDWSIDTTDPLYMEAQKPGGNITVARYRLFSESIQKGLAEFGARPGNDWGNEILINSELHCVGATK